MIKNPQLFEEKMLQNLRGYFWHTDYTLSRASFSRADTQTRPSV